MTLVSALSTGCGGRSHLGDAAAGPPRHGGEVVLVSAQEPPTINTWLATGGMAITSTITDPLHTPWVRLDDTGNWRPALLERVPTLANGDVRPRGAGMVVRARIRQAARWSDKTAITCDDLRFTWQTVLDPRWRIGTTVGWEEVTAVRCPTPRQVELHFRSRYAPYLASVLASAPLPAHELRGANFDRIWRDEITVSSGPFVFDHWTRGVELVLRRNPHYWAAGEARRPYLDRIVWRFVPDTSAMKLELRMEEAHLIGLPPDTNQPRELDGIHTARHVEAPGAAWEQLTFNVARPPLDDPRVRRAVALAIDRDEMLDVVLRGQARSLDSTLITSLRPYSIPAFRDIRPDPAALAKLMREAGYVRTGTAPWMRDGAPARLELVTTAGNPLRSKLTQLLQQELQDAGFSVDIEIGRPEVLFQQVVAPGRFHLALYSFSAGSDPSQTRIFACAEVPRAPDYSGKNNYRYCNPAVDRLTRAADHELDPLRRARLLHAMQRQLARDLPVLPLFQPPDTLAWSRHLHGVRPNPGGRHTWNTEDWWVDP